MTSCDGNEVNREVEDGGDMFHVCIARCMRKFTKCQNVKILVSTCGAM